MEELTIPLPRIENGSLYGKLYVADDGKRHPALIISHGYNGSNEDFSEDCHYFAQNGIAAFAYDFAGGSTRSKSSGKTTDMTLLSEKDDLLTVLDYIRSLDCVDSSKIFLLGGSQGGLISALVADERPDAIRALALYFPALCIPDNWREKYPEGSKIPDVIDFWGMRLGRPFVETANEIDIAKQTGHFDRPVLIVHGDRDAIVPLSYAEDAAKRYPDAGLSVLKGEGHGFRPEGAAQARTLVLQHIQKVLGN